MDRKLVALATLLLTAVDVTYARGGGRGGGGGGGGSGKGIDDGWHVHALLKVLFGADIVFIVIALYLLFISFYAQTKCDSSNKSPFRWGAAFCFIYIMSLTFEAIYIHKYYPNGFSTLQESIGITSSYIAFSNSFDVLLATSAVVLLWKRAEVIGKKIGLWRKLIAYGLVVGAFGTAITVAALNAMVTCPVGVKVCLANDIKKKSNLALIIGTSPLSLQLHF